MPQYVKRMTIPLSAAALLLVAAFSNAQTKLLRYPDIHGDKVVFCYAGDLWLAPSSGGPAARLTAHPGQELFPKFSPDGRWVAFTGQYDGDEQVYVIPTAGGVPKQLTFYPARGPLNPRWGYDNQVYGWANDGKAVLFRGMDAGWDLGESRLYTISVDGGLPEPLPMRFSGAGAFSPDGTKVVFSPLARDFRTWKRYEGGWAQDLWIFDLKTYAAENITNNPRTDRDPMWIGDAVYFASDRDGTLNLYRYDIASKAVNELTHSTNFDARWPSCDRSNGQIVYELGGELHVYDVNANSDKPISIFVPNDGVAMRPSRVSAAKFIEEFDISPKGERAVFVARGDIFTAPIEKGPTRNLTDTSNAHDRSVAWSPDGTMITFISDKSGEEEIYLINQDGKTVAQQLTTGGKVRRSGLIWSPDGKRLAFTDKDGWLYALTVGDKSMVEVAKDRRGFMRGYSWSPDGNYLAFSSSTISGYRTISIWSAADKKIQCVTDVLFNSFSPTWDPDGKYLYFLSDREFVPQISNIEWNFAGNRTTDIIAMALRKDVKNPFPPESDEVTIEKPGEPKKDAESKVKAPVADKEKDKAKAAEKKTPFTIDFDGIAARTALVPVPADNYDGLKATKENLIFMCSGAFYYNHDGDVKSALQVFTFKDRKVTTLAEDVDGYVVSSDFSKVLVQQGSDYNLYDANAKGKDTKKTVATKDLMVNRIPAQEWEEIFNEVWRRYRDFFYVKNMHGYDWDAIGKQYRALLPYVAHRSDLNYVLGEMVAELNVSHAYIEGGDFEIPARPKVALPGARLELDKASGRYRIAKIYKGENEEDRYRSPLMEIGMNVKEGDYVLEIDGQELKAADSPYHLLLNKADRPVQLTVNDKPDLKGARQITYKPVTSEVELRYIDWVTHNREMVAQLTNGRVGYLHVPDMGEDGIREFIKWYYPQIRKEGLIVDVRANGGGNVSQMLIERLRRALLGTGFGRTNEDTETYPDATFFGHMVCMINEMSASDGDIFPYMFRQAGLGPIIGKRTWGGVVGISGHGSLIDGGQVFVPEDATASADGKWVIEGHGVDPDIVVENDPKSLIENKDLQLERAVAEVMKQIDAKPLKLPSRPADPVKTK